MLRHILRVVAILSCAWAAMARAEPAPLKGEFTRGKRADRTQEPRSKARPGEASAQGSDGTRADASQATEKKAVKARAGKGRGVRTSANEGARCLSPLVRVVRRRGPELEQRRLHLTTCDGEPNPAAVDSLSVLARPDDVQRPSLREIRRYRRRTQRQQTARATRMDLTSDVRRLHPELVQRLQALAEAFPGKTIELVSGHRPGSRRSSRHYQARALDLRVQGVADERVRDVLRRQTRTGVGYYPNSTFVHVDVRDEAGYWVDRSGPGEPADYGPWPPKPQEIREAKRNIVNEALAALRTLGETGPVSTNTGGDQRSAPHPPHWHGEDLSQAELERIRSQARAALNLLATPDD